MASVNVKDLEVATAPLDEAAILSLMGGENESAHVPSVEELRRLPGAKVVSLHPGAATNTPADHKIDTEQVLGGKDRRGPIGIALRYTARPGTNQARETSEGAVAQVTDLAISAKVSPHGSLVWVTRLSNAAPVEGAQVRIMAKGDAPGAPFVTDKNGFATIPESAFKPAHRSQEHAVIFARTADDWAYRPVGDALNAWRFGTSVDLGPDRPFGMLFSDRGFTGRGIRSTSRASSARRPRGGRRRRRAGRWTSRGPGRTGR